MTVQELNQDQLDELKVQYVFDHNPDPYWSDIAYSINIPNEVIFEEYGHINFVEDDFIFGKED